jgi:long-chain acyl-CoA synthetase
VSSNSNLTEEEVRSFYANQLARYKWPRDIVFRDELPLSNIGKVLRRELRDN